MLHVVREFNETAEPTRPSYALPATLKSEERRHGKTPFQTRPPLDQRLESHAKRLRNDRVCSVHGTCVTKRVEETQKVKSGLTRSRRERDQRPFAGLHFRESSLYVDATGRCGSDPGGKWIVAAGPAGAKGPRQQLIPLTPTDPRC